MRITYVGHDYRYAVEQSVMALLGVGRENMFSPEIFISQENMISPENMSSQGGGDYLVTTLESDGELIKGRADLSYGGAEASGTSEVHAGDFDESWDRVRRGQHAIKTAIFKAVRGVTNQHCPWGSLSGMRPTKLARSFLEEGKSTAEVTDLFKDRYYLEPARAKLLVEAATNGIKATEGFKDGDISLYVGIPFCPSRCSYCSFVSHDIGRSADMIEPYLDVLAEEIKIKGGLVRDLGLSVKTIYIGGGTPTALSAAQLERLLAQVADSFSLSGLLEYTVEAGRPDTISREKMEVIKAGGADRISINPQSMDQTVLDLCRRPHSPEDIVKANEIARSVGFKSINMDIIAGLPGDSKEGFRRTLEEVLRMSPENITVHTLALKRGADMAAEAVQSPKAADVLEMLDFSIELLYNNGHIPYYLYRQKYMAASLENTGWTRPGYESLYNICIMEEFQTILSAGAGGITKIVSPKAGRIQRYANNKFPREYMASLDKIRQDCVTISETFGKGGA